MTTSVLSVDHDLKRLYPFIFNNVIKKIYYNFKYNVHIIQTLNLIMEKRRWCVGWNDGGVGRRMEAVPWDGDESEG